MTAPLLNTVDPQFDPLDVPLFAEYALAELQDGADTLSASLLEFSKGMQCLPLRCQRELVIYLKQAMVRESQMSVRFLRRLLLDTAESVLAQRSLPSYISD